MLSGQEDCFKRCKLGNQQIENKAEYKYKRNFRTVFIQGKGSCNFHLSGYPFDTECHIE